MISPEWGVAQKGAVFVAGAKQKGVSRMTVLTASVGKLYEILAVTGKEKSQQYLKTLGFYPGSSLLVVSKHKSAVILLVKDSRYAIDRNLAERISIGVLKEERGGTV